MPPKPSKKQPARRPKAGRQAQSRGMTLDEYRKMLVHMLLQRKLDPDTARSVMKKL